MLLEDDREKAAWAALGRKAADRWRGESLLITPGWPPIMVTSNGDRTMQHQVVSREELLAARLGLLTEEKELTRRSDELAQRRQELPWVRADKDYRFDTDDGRLVLKMPPRVATRRSAWMKAGHRCQITATPQSFARGFAPGPQQRPHPTFRRPRPAPARRLPPRSLRSLRLQPSACAGRGVPLLAH